MRPGKILGEHHLTLFGTMATGMDQFDRTNLYGFIDRWYDRHNRVCGPWYHYQYIPLGDAIKDHIRKRVLHATR